jgi:hypothetical protein
MQGSMVSRFKLKHKPPLFPLTELFVSIPNSFHAFHFFPRFPIPQNLRLEFRCLSAVPSRVSA